MKKTLAFVMLGIACITILWGCENDAGRMIDEGVRNGDMAVLNSRIGAQQQRTAPDTNETADFIGEERAKELALKRAGLTRDQVIFDRSELDLDDGTWHYEIEFRKDGIKYEADIRARDGKFLNWEMDAID